VTSALLPRRGPDGRALRVRIECPGSVVHNAEAVVLETHDPILKLVRLERPERLAGAEIWFSPSALRTCMPAPAPRGDR
jgi:hypothetical protein